MKTFTFERVMCGPWGSSPLGKELSVEAENINEAWKIINSRQDAKVRHVTGEYETWFIK